MALRIVNNLAAMNTQRWLSVADAGMKKSLERLSSGYRINKAADDAAGLAISQAFRANIASFKVASRNTSEAAALLQVAEGGMDQIGNMLTRLKELATQAASANAGQAERDKIDAEADQLIIEIDRIADSTKYGSTALLDGNFGATQVGALAVGAAVSNGGIVDDANDNIRYSFSSGGVLTGTEVTAVGAAIEEGTWTIGYTAATAITIANSSGTVVGSYSAADVASGGSITFASLGITLTYTADQFSTSIGQTAGAGGTTELKFERTGLTSLNVNGATTGTYTISDGTGTGIKIYGPGGTPIQEIDWVAAGQTINFDILNVSFKLDSDYSYTTSELNDMTLTVSANTDSTGNTFQIGAENNADNQIAIAIDGVGTTTIGINTLDLSSTSGAQAALGSIDEAVSALAGSRGDIGAYMNRLSYASANLATTIENTQAAESVIRDVDMASEMTYFTKNQILLQAGTAMLAQANMAPQQVLALFG